MRCIISFIRKYIQWFEEKNYCSINNSKIIEQNIKKHLREEQKQWE
jgi:hypothetical protein